MSRVAVVTGAAGEIGSATCDVLAARGWVTIGVDRRPMARPGAIQLDLADPQEIAAKLGALQQVDGLVNNGARQLFKTLLETTVDEWDGVLAVNLRAAFACVQAVASQLAATKGAIVNVASVHALATSASIAAYAASKGGLVAFTRSAALELAPLGVRVNAVLPGAISTPALRDGFSRDADAEQRLIDRTPLMRIGQPHEIAHAIDFLLDGERSSFITGQSLVADGGALAHLATE